MIPDLVIFDCDGVIVDSEGPTCEVIANGLRRYGMDIDGHGVHERFIGGTIDNILKEGREQGYPLPDNWVTEVYDEMYDLLAKGVPLSEGFIDLIDALEAQGTRTAIASNGAMEKMQTTLGPHGLYERFDGRIYSGHAHKAPKPAPGMLLAAMAQAGAAPERTFMIDDSPAGAGAAKAAGTGFFGFIEHGNAALMAPLGVDLVDSMGALKAKLVQ